MSIFTGWPRATDHRSRHTADSGGLRPTAQIRAQYQAARAFAGDVAAMQTTSHRYTAGQAAALAWIMNDGPPPLTFGPAMPGRPSDTDVRRLQDRSRELLEISDDAELFPRAYVMGVDYVCRWARRHTEIPPIPTQADRPSDLRSPGFA